MSREEKLTILIEVLFDWIEKENPALLHYGTINFRGALERFFYFDAVNRPEGLRPLLKAASAWRVNAEDEGLFSFYDACFTLMGSRGFLSSFIYHLRMIMHLIRLRLAAISSCLCPSLWEKKTNVELAPVAFFALCDRFVYFFKEVVKGLAPNECIFLSTNGLVKEEVASGIGAKLIRPSCTAVRWSDVNIGIHHPLFFPYLRVLRVYEMNHAMLAKHKPSVLFFAEGTSMEDETMAMAAKSLGVPTLRLQSGRAGVLHSGYRRMSFDKMLCWGAGFVERFKKYSPGPEYVITGSPVLDYAQMVEQELSGSRGHTISIFTQPVSTHISSNDYQQLVELAEKMIRQDAKINLVIRKHPTDIAQSFDALMNAYPARIKMMNTETHSLAEVLHSSIGAVGFFSTTLSEAAAYGVVPIILKLKEQHSVFPYPEKHGASIVTSNINEATEWVLKIMYQPETLNDVRKSMKNFSKEYFGPQDGLAVKRILECIRKASKENVPH